MNRYNKNTVPSVKYHVYMDIKTENKKDINDKEFDILVNEIKNTINNWNQKNISLERVIFNDQYNLINEIEYSDNDCIDCEIESNGSEYW